MLNVGNVRPPALLTTWPDVLVVVLLAEVAGNGFSAEYKFVVEGGVLIGTILFWSYMLE